MKPISPFIKRQPFKKQKKPSLWEKFTSFVTNVKYDISKQLHQVTQNVFEKQQDTKNKFIIIQGKTYRNRIQAKNAVKQIIWFSYRKGFNIKNQFTSDVGWGCLVRVGQMALASALIKYFQSQKNFNLLGKDTTIESIIQAFTDVQGRQERYSLNKLIQIAANEFQQKVGQWFDLAKISHTLKIAQNKFPMKGAQNLEILYFDQSLNIPTIHKVQSIAQCKCAKKRIVCQKCHFGTIQHMKQQYSQIQTPNGSFHTYRASEHQQNMASLGMKKKKGPHIDFAQTTNSKKNIYNNGVNVDNFRKKRLKRDMLILLLTRVSDPKQIHNTNRAVFSLLDVKTCLGIMTGFPRQAIFVVGRQEDRLIYLNPHYVQKNTRFQTQHKNSYFCQEYHLTERQRLDPSMVFCFYIQTLQELEILEQAIKRINQNNPDVLSIGIDYLKLPFDINEYMEDQDELTSLTSFVM